jgi:hypothetical protein
MSVSVEIYGALLRSFLNAGESLKLLLQGEVEKIESFEPDNGIRSRNFINYCGWRPGTKTTAASLNRSALK